MAREHFTAKGECNGNHKLTTSEVIEIRERYARRMQIGQRCTMPELARRFHVSVNAIARILRRTAWKHVA